MTSNLPFGTLWFTVLLMLGLAVLFLMTRLPERGGPRRRPGRRRVHRPRVRRYAAGGGPSPREVADDPHPRQDYAHRSRGASSGGTSSS